MVPSGLSAEELFKRGEEIAYDGFTILDTRYSSIGKKDVSLKTNLGKGIALQIPIIASPMDSVVNPKLAIAIAREGGVAVIHYNHKDAEGNPSIEKQIADIRAVKRAQNGLIENPVCVSPDMTIKQVIARGDENKVGDEPIKTFPVTHDGSSNGVLVGLLRGDDYFHGTFLQIKVRERMLPFEKLVYENEEITIEKAREILWERKICSVRIE